MMKFKCSIVAFCAAFFTLALFLGLAPYPTQAASFHQTVYVSKVAHACPPTIENGSTGSWVSDLQSDLNSFGYGPLQVDGIFGMRTASAVGQFQRDHGLADDEIVGPLTWHALGYC